MERRVSKLVAGWARGAHKGAIAEEPPGRTGRRCRPRRGRCIYISERKEVRLVVVMVKANPHCSKRSRQGGLVLFQRRVCIMCIKMFS